MSERWHPREGQLATHEPSCLCVANWDGPPCVRACEPLDRRALLRELLGGRR